MSLFFSGFHEIHAKQEKQAHCHSQNTVKSADFSLKKRFLRESRESVQKNLKSVNIKTK